MFKKDFKRDLKLAAVSLGYHSKPNCVIIGAQKAGTSGLFYTLKQHPYCESSYQKELHFFDRENYSKKDLNDYYIKFPLPHNLNRKNKVIYEATPSYLYHPETPKRLFQFDPDLKLIVCLRNPAERALSAWNMYHNFFKNHPQLKRLYDQRSFFEAINDEIKNIDDVNFNQPSYVKRGIYYYQIENYYKFFSKEQILILKYENLKNSYKDSMKEICSFLKISFEVPKRVTSNVGTKYDLKNFKESLELLTQFFKPHNRKLFDLIGKDYPW